MKIKTNRDITIIPLGNKESLVIGCDVCGGIGEKPADNLRVSGELVGRLTTRVALMEVIAVGASPLIVVDTLSVEMEPSGQKILAGIRKELDILNSPIPINGSTEENIPTQQTGVGVTVVGRAENGKLKLNTTQGGDLLAAVGLPRVGEAVIKENENISDLNTLLKLKEVEWIHEILPVGSRGVAVEAGLLARSSGFSCEYKPECDLDLTVSAGPATVILVSLASEDLNKLKSLSLLPPINVVGEIK